MNRTTAVALLFLATTACNNSESEIHKAIRDGLTNTEGAKFGEIKYGQAKGGEFACAGLETKNRLGTFNPFQVALARDDAGQWLVLEALEGTAESCMKTMHDDLGGLNDSIPPSAFRIEPPAGTKDSSAPFKRDEVRWIDTYGDNVVQGTVGLKSRSGTEYRCSTDSDAVNLIPASSYARERMKIIYGNDVSGFRGTDSPVATADPLYLKMMKETGCDEAGRFVFQNVPDGEYFIGSFVTWKVQKRPPLKSLQGGSVMKRISVAGGEVKKVTLTAP